ncbi:hypothetical protein D9757_004516 [Collybiopsis confluens]|uniref:Transmembrane protein n=1 Tax=Collybiopsis confluens TaxID=2823264 RepID=A0A8H5HWL3_9AGAR|nr:hypothetical protein D9757_004516 [Collybiopsis confluens]
MDSKELSLPSTSSAYGYKYMAGDPSYPSYTLVKADSEDWESASSAQDSQQQTGNIRTSVRPEYNIQGRYLEILSLLLLAVLIACMNHVAFSHLDGKEPGSHTSQFWVTVLKNIFPAAVTFLLFTDLKNCLLQVVLYHIQLDPHPIGVLNLMTSPPSLFSTLNVLFKSSMRALIVSFAFMTAITHMVALTSLLVPGTLSVVPSPPRTQTLEVPTIDLSLMDASQSGIYITAAMAAACCPSGVEQHWGNMGSSSRMWFHMLLYVLLFCARHEMHAAIERGHLAGRNERKQLLKEDIWPDEMNASSSRLYFGPGQYSFYNSTSTWVNNTSHNNDFIQNVDVLYMENFNSTQETRNLLLSGVLEPDQWTPVGVHCSFYNATYEAKTNFSNNRQLSSTRVIEWHAPMTFFMDDTNVAMATFSIVDSLIVFLGGDAFYDPSDLRFQIDSEVHQNTVLFDMIGYRASEGDPGSDYFRFSLSPALGGNISAGMQELLGNVTLAYVNEHMATAYVEAIVTPKSTEYQYVGWRLGLIYGVVFGFTLLVIAYGLYCLRRNGMFAVFDLEHILEMTATSTCLHESAAHPDFGSTMVRGVIPDKARRRIVVLEVSR